MPAALSGLLECITIDPDVRFGRPCIRGHRITVQEIPEWLSSGASQEQILADSPQLEADDFLAVYAHVAEQMRVEAGTLSGTNRCPDVLIWGGLPPADAASDAAGEAVIRRPSYPRHFTPKSRVFLAYSTLRSMWSRC